MQTIPTSVMTGTRHGEVRGESGTFAAETFSTVTGGADTMERATFEMHLSQWEKETSFLSAGQFDNENYRAIVGMGDAAVPFIAEAIGREPSQIVYALAEICGDKVARRPFISLERLCRLWLKILKREGRI